MYECMESFSAPTRAWFEHAFAAPTEAQRLAWPAIHDGSNVLVIAPTGSGKTLSAFLAAIDGCLARKAGRDPETAPRAKRGRAGGVRVLYVSPLKALGVDVARNLRTPLEGIRAQYEARGLGVPDVSVAIRTGDSTAKERRAIVSHPPDILVTTPESLYLMLTSKARSVLEAVETVIIDEVHAVAGTKRGAHLALSLERLDARLARPAQRIGLSATVDPVDVVAQFLGGARPVVVARASGRPELDLRIVEAAGRMGDGGARRSRTSGETTPRISGVTPAMHHAAQRRRDRDARGASDGAGAHPRSGAAGDPNAGVWPRIAASVLDEILAHRTTLVFVNSRGQAERFTAQLNDLWRERRGTPPPVRDEPAHYASLIGSTTKLAGPVTQDDAIAMAHHGSVSKDRRKRIEDRLKAGSLRCVVATSSLELGIDMGSVDLVIQIAPPPSVASGLQRVGRADHRVGGMSHALVYPLTREQIIGAAASVEGMLAGAIEPLRMPRNPLDVLAQQTVAAASLEPLPLDAWFGIVRRAAPYAHLERDMFDAVVGMVSGAYDGEEFSAFRPALVLDEDAGVLAARPGAQRLAVTSGGTIPDRGLYTVVLPEGESGTGPRRVGELDEEMVYESRVGDVITLGTTSWQIQEITADRVVVLPASGRSARLPFWHGEGDGMDYRFALARGRWLGEVARGLTEAGRSARDADGGPRFDAPTLERLGADGLDATAVADLAAFLDEQRACTGIVPDDAHIVVERCRDEEGDWRVVVHMPFGRRVHEPWALALDARMRHRYGIDGQVHAADEGLVLRVPDGDGRVDVSALLAIDPEDIGRVVEEQVSASVLFAARFRECAARALFMPRADPGRRVPLWQQRLRAAQLLGAARAHRDFPLLLETARECLQDVYDVPALRGVLTRIRDGAVTIHDVETSSPSPMADHLLFGFVGSVMYQYDAPQAERRAQLLGMDPRTLERLLGVDDLSVVLDDAVIDEIGAQLAARTFWNELDAGDMAGRVRRYAKTHTPFTLDRMLADLDVPAEAALGQLESLRDAGRMLTGRFDDRLAADSPQWVDAQVLRRIRSRSLAKARRAVRPVDQEDFQSFVFERQGVGSVGGERFEGEDGVMRVIEQLEGVALPIGTWERDVLPARVRDYDTAMLDDLVARGEVVWVGAGDDAGERIGAVAFHPFDSLQLHARCEDTPDAQDSSGDGIGVQEAVMRALADGGAYDAQQLRRRARELWFADPEAMIDPATGEVVENGWTDSAFDEALWALVRAGRVTNSSFAVARAAAGGGRESRNGPTPRRRRMRARGASRPDAMGLWRAVRPGDDPASPEERAIDLVELLLDRYGVLARPIAELAGVPGGFPALYPVLRRMEEQGTLVRGMFVRGLGASQFARRETVDLLRERHGRGAVAVALDVLDPAVLTGAVTPWPRPVSLAPAQRQESRQDASERAPAKPVRRSGALVAFHAGEPVLYLTRRSGRMTLFSDIGTAQRRACEALAAACERAGRAAVVRECNGVALTTRLPIGSALRAAGFAPVPQGMKLYR